MLTLSLRRAGSPPKTAMWSVATWYSVRSGGDASSSPASSAASAASRASAAASLAASASSYAWTAAWMTARSFWAPTPAPSFSSRCASFSSAPKAAASISVKDSAMRLGRRRPAATGGRCGKCLLPECRQSQQSIRAADYGWQQAQQRGSSAASPVGARRFASRLALDRARLADCEGVARRALSRSRHFISVITSVITSATALHTYNTSCPRAASECAIK